MLTLPEPADAVYNAFRSRVVLTLLVLVLAASCRSTAPPAPALTSGIDFMGMDKSVNPGDDFFAYANGGWLNSTPIPADKASYGIFSILADETRKRTVARIQEAAAATPAASEDARRIGNFYSSYMDEAAIESKGTAPLKPKLDAVAAITNRTDLARILGGNLRADVDPLNNTNFKPENLLGVWVTQGLNDPSHSIPYILQGGL